MKILSAKVHNFASYKELEFKFDDQGLTLISGPTGSGKSTLCDVIPWILFGKTAKNGTADEIRSWNVEEPTQGECLVVIGQETLCVTRVRGKNANDLFYTKGGVRTRGKDLLDTQKLLNSALGMDGDTYLAGSYFHEFSQTAQFFTANAKTRRSITEQLADLSLPTILQEKASAYTKSLKTQIEALKQEASLKKNTLGVLDKQLISESNKAKDWEKTHKQAIAKTESKIRDFESDKRATIAELEEDRDRHDEETQHKITDLLMQIEELKITVDEVDVKGIKALIAELNNDKCSECGSAKHSGEVLALEKTLYKHEAAIKQKERNDAAIISLNNRIESIKKQPNPYIKSIDNEKNRENNYLEQLGFIMAEVNPYLITTFHVESVILKERSELEVIETLLLELNIDQSDAALLVSTNNEFRGAIISRTVNYLQENTNKLLGEHFDAEIRVKFSVADADKLDVEITKDGNLASYAQLSKGQRQLLKLSFGVSVMKAISNYNGISFNCVFMDEALDGMDDNIKAKSYTLLEALALEYSSVFCVEHSEAFKSLFTNRYEVELTSQGSAIEKT